MSRHLFLGLLFILAGKLSLNGQGFGVDDTLKVINKTTASSTPPHEYFQLSNASGHDISMRWKVNHSITNYPVQWQIAIQDNVTYYNPAPDSADFLLPDTVGSMDKIIINVYHNGFAGNGIYAVDLINLDSSDQVITVRFVINITYQNGLIEQAISPIVVCPNPASDYITLSGLENLDGNSRIEIHSMNGGLVMVISGDQIWNRSIDVSGLYPGVYFITSINNEKKQLIPTPFIKQNGQ